MVFQNYALYPHMTVRENMGFALKLAKVDKAEIDKKVEEAAKILDLTEHLDRKPANLSGGQRQRVAMGRAIVRDPRAFLMDEPLSNLDAKLRVQMRTEVSRIQQRLGTTTVYVTHDQTEAMTLGDRVAVMRAGVLQQVGLADGALQRAQEPVRGRLHRLAGDELHAGERSRATRSSCRWREVRLPQELREQLERRAAHATDRRHPAGGLRGRRRWWARRRTAAPPSRPRSTCSSRWARSSTPTSRSRRDQQIESDELRELAEDSGAGEVPGAGAEGQIVARLDAAAKVKEGGEAELWVDATKIKLFDPSDGAQPHRRLFLQLLDHLLVPLVGAKEALAQRRRARRPRSPCGSPIEVRLAQHLDHRQVLLANHASRHLLAAHELPASLHHAEAPGLHALRQAGVAARIARPGCARAPRPGAARARRTAARGSSAAGRRGVISRSRRRRSVHLGHVGVDHLEAQRAGDRHAVVAVLDEVQLADPVDVDRRHRLAAALGRGDPLPARAHAARGRAGSCGRTRARGRPCRRSSRARSSGARAASRRAGRAPRRPPRTGGSRSRRSARRAGGWPGATAPACGARG